MGWLANPRDQFQGSLAAAAAAALSHAKGRSQRTTLHVWVARGMMVISEELRHDAAAPAAAASSHAKR